MREQTKNVLTRELLGNELRFYNTADIKSSLLLGGILALFFIPITIGVVNWIVSEIDNVPLEIILGIGGGAVISAPVGIYVISLVRSLWERKMLLGGNFDITVRTLSYKSEKLVNRRLREYLHFEGFRAIWVPHNTFQLSSMGDEFYLIHYKSKNSIKLLYPIKMYEYIEK